MVNRFNPDFALEKNSSFGLKAQNTVAQGNALGKMMQSIIALKGHANKGGGGFVLPFQGECSLYRRNPGRCPALLCQVRPSAHKIAVLPLS